ncbi:MAG: FtsX-like permease family protein [Anaerolineae bacterium]|nr:FtsX-like permease family protein [Anaerolineae bacterium]
MKRIFYFFSLLILALRRLWQHKGLAFCLLLGSIAAVSLTVSIPIYTDAISRRVLNAQLFQDAETRAPPFSFLFRYVGSWKGFLEWEDCQPVDQFISQDAASLLGLPAKQMVRHFKTDKMQLFPASDAQYQDTRKAITFVALGFISDVESHIDLLEGRFPQPVTNSSDPIEVLVPFKLVESFGFQANEEYIVYSSGDTQTFSHKVHIAGVWQAIDPADPYWFYAQSAFEEMLLIPEASYAQMSKAMKGEVGLASWSLICDGSALRSETVPGLVRQIVSLQNQSNAFLNGIELIRSPQDALVAHLHVTQSLTVLLYMFSVPILAVVFYFISLIAAMIVRRQRNEIAVLRSRGMAMLQVTGLFLLEGLIVGALSMAAGVFLGERFAQVMGLTRSFLILDRRSLLPTTLSWNTLRFGLIAVLASIAASLGPAIEAARETIVSYKQEQARARRASLWQRAFIDLLLLVPALYGLWVLRGRGSVAPATPEGLTASSAAASASSFSDPLAFGVPVFLVFGIALFAIRIFPALMRLLAWLANVWRGAVPVLVFRHLSRTSRQHTGPLLLLILTLSLAVFTASMARTLDDYTLAKAYYDVGADLRLVEAGESTQTEGVSGSALAPQPAQTQVEGAQWLFLPVETHLDIGGVESAARVWVKTADVTLPTKKFTARLMGIDRTDLPRVAFFRSDFAPASLGALMNALAVRNDGILASREVLDYGVAVGDQVDMVLPLGNNPRAQFTIVGMIDLFPRLYPEDGPFFVANLEHIFNLAGGIYPYDVWLKTSQTLGAEGVQIEARNLGFNVTAVYNARADVERAIQQPDRQGVFGLLSVGFIISALLTVLGFLIYAYLSFWQRQIELGILRALGLSAGQMALSLVLEQLTLILAGAAVGTGAGVLVSRLFIPFLQVGVGEHAQTPPFVVQVAWTEIAYIYAVFGAMFVAAVIALFFFLRRLRIFEAIKLGETT